MKSEPMTADPMLNAALDACLAQMDEAYAKAKQAMGIKPQLALADSHALAAANAVLDVTEVILRAQYAGTKCPPALADRVNRFQDKLEVLLKEIESCLKLVARGSAAPKSLHSVN